MCIGLCGSVSYSWRYLRNFSVGFLFLHFLFFMVRDDQNSLYVCVHAKSLQLCPTLCNPMDLNPPGSSVHGDSPGKNTGVGWQALLEGIFQTQGSNPHLLCLLHWLAGSLSLLSPGKPMTTPTSWQIEGEKVQAVTDFIFLGSKITADGDCRHEI